MRAARRALPRAFTLVELLVVISIIGILVGILVPAISHAISEATRLRAQAVLDKCSAALGMYRNDHSGLPWTKAAEVKALMSAGKAAQVEIKTSAVLAELRGRGSLNKTADYLSGLESRHVQDLGAGPTLVDAWGREIRFRVDPATGEPVVWSVGPNGVDETNNGVSPDPVGQPQIYYVFTVGKGGDDLRGK